jgi:hypothetical protein
MTPVERVIAGHVRKTASGYRMLYCPQHPFAQSSTGCIMEHRVIAERKLGRFLHEDEVVHHLNGDKLDNRPENLHVCDSVEHGRIHALQRWAA